MNFKKLITNYYRSYWFAAVELLLSSAITLSRIIDANYFEEHVMLTFLFITYIWYLLVLIIFEKRKNTVTKFSAAFVDKLEKIMRYLAKISPLTTILILLGYKFESERKLYICILGAIMILLFVLISINFFFYNFNKKNEG